MKTNILLTVAAAALGLSASAHAAGAPDAPKAPEARSTYVLTPGDRITISITGQQELNKIATIGAAGTVTMLYVDDIKLAGKTVSQAQDAIEQTYIDKHILKRPEAIVTL